MNDLRSNLRNAVRMQEIDDLQNSATRAKIPKANFANTDSVTTLVMENIKTELAVKNKPRILKN
jgi:hypothetical protein